MQRQQQRLLRQHRLQQRPGRFDLRHAGQKYQHVTGLFAVESGTGAGDRGGRMEPVERSGGAPALFHRELTARRLDHRHIAEQSGDRLRLQRRGHHQHLQLRTERIAQIEHQRQPEIGIETAFVKFIEDDQRGILQHRVLLNPADQHPLGDHQDPGLLRVTGVAAHDVADPAAHRFAEQ